MFGFAFQRIILAACTLACGFLAVFISVAYDGPPYVEHIWNVGVASGFCFTLFALFMRQDTTARELRMIGYLTLVMSTIYALVHLTSHNPGYSSYWLMLYFSGLGAFVSFFLPKKGE